MATMQHFPHCLDDGSFPLLSGCGACPGSDSCGGVNLFVVCFSLPLPPPNLVSFLLTFSGKYFLTILPVHQGHNALMV